MDREKANREWARGLRSLDTEEILVEMYHWEDFVRKEHDYEDGQDAVWRAKMCQMVMDYRGDIMSSRPTTDPLIDY